jgi:hypothetical protein
VTSIEQGVAFAPCNVTLSSPNVTFVVDRVRFAQANVAFGVARATFAQRKLTFCADDVTFALLEGSAVVQNATHTSHEAELVEAGVALCRDAAAFSGPSEAAGENVVPPISLIGWGPIS